MPKFCIYQQQTISSKFYIKITLLGSKNLLCWEKIFFEGPNTFHNKLSTNQKKI